jgi:putative two-component system response regulator
MTKKKILLVDDDEIHLVTAELFLKDEFEIYKAKSGNEALTYLGNNEFVPDLIMLDIIMPNMDGWELFKRIKTMGSLKNIPIVFLSSEGGNKEKQRAFTMGAVDYITKPFNMTDLKSRIKEMLKKAQR